MKPIGKQTFLVGLVLVLGALNVGLIGFMFYSQHKESGPGGADTARIMISELNLDKTQEERYLQLQQQFSDKLAPIKQKEMQFHDRFFEMMHEERPDSSAVAAIIDSMGANRGEIEYITFVHFRQVRALCNAQQRQKFDRIISETMRRMGPPPPRRDRLRKRRNREESDGPQNNEVHGKPEEPATK